MRLFRRRRFEQDMAEELRLHLENRIEDLVRSGLSRAEAARRAGIEFGGVEKYKEQCRESRGLQFIDDLRSDILFFLRSLRRNALLSAVVVLTLTLGIGMDTGVFTMINAVAFRARVDKDPDSYLFVLPAYSQDGGRQSRPGLTELSDYLAFRDGNRSLSKLAAWNQFQVTLGDDTAETRALLVTCDFFSLHGLERPKLGRLFAAEDCSQPGGAPIIVLSEEIWRDRFAADPNVVGKTIRIIDQIFTVAGVTPLRFSGKINGAKAWMPYTMQPLLGYGFNAFRGNETPWLLLAGRLKTGYSRNDAKNELSLLATQQDRLHAGRNTTLTITNGSWFEDPAMRQIGIWTIPIIIGALTLVLLIACANVTTLLLSRAAARQHEISVRLALGAGRGRLLRMLLTESLLLASVAGLFSLFMAYRIPPLLEHFLLADAGQTGQFPLTPDWRVFAYTCGVALLAGCVSGLAPALESLKVELSASLRGIGGLLGGAVKSGSRTRDILVGAQVAMSLVLLAGAGIFVHAQYQLMTVDPGFETNQTLFIRMRQRDQPPGKPLDNAIGQRVAGLPGVRSVAFAQMAPFAGPEMVSRCQIAPNEPPRQALINIVSPRFFETMGIPMLHGRGFSENDTPMGVAVVSETGARLFWPGENPIGKRMTAAAAGALEVVGVARDASSIRVAASGDPLVYVMWDPASRAYPMLVHFSGNRQAMERAVGATLRETGPNMVVVAQTIQSMVDQQISAFGKLATLVLILGGVALALATMGIYGVVAFAATRRTKELGIRMALGARKRHIIWEMLASSAKPIAGGLFAGLLLTLAASVVLTRVMARAPFTVDARDPIAYVAVALLLAATAAVAILIPARRAAAADPLQSLRQE